MALQNNLSSVELNALQQFFLKRLEVPGGLVTDLMGAPMQSPLGQNVNSIVYTQTEAVGLLQPGTQPGEPIVFGVENFEKRRLTSSRLQAATKIFEWDNIGTGDLGQLLQSDQVQRMYDRAALSLDKMFVDALIGPAEVSGIDGRTWDQVTLPKKMYIPYDDVQWGIDPDVSDTKWGLSVQKLRGAMAMLKNCQCPGPFIAIMTASAEYQLMLDPIYRNLTTNIQPSAVGSMLSPIGQLTDFRVISEPVYTPPTYTSEGKTWDTGGTASDSNFIEGTRLEHVYVFQMGAVNWFSNQPFEVRSDTTIDHSPALSLLMSGMYGAGRRQEEMVAVIEIIVSDRVANAQPQDQKTSTRRGSK